MAVPSVPDRAVDPDLHSFSLLDPDPDPHSICGSGSSRINLSTKNRKSTRKLPVLWILIRTDPIFKKSSWNVSGSAWTGSRRYKSLENVQVHEVNTELEDLK